MTREAPETSLHPMLLMLPGLDGTGLFLEPLKNLLEMEGIDVRIIAYPRDKVMDYQKLHDWLLQRYMPKTPFYLLAESFGGPLAVMLTHSLGTQVQGLILAATFLHQPVLPSLQLVAKSLIPLYHPKLLHMLPIGTILGTNDNNRDSLLNILQVIPPEIIRVRMASALEIDVRTEYRQLEIPRLVFCPKHDHLLDIRPEDFQHPQATIHNMGDASHLLLLNQPECCVQDILTLLGRP